MAAGDLTTVEKVRDYIFGPEATLDADAILTDLVTAASTWVVSQIGRPVLTATYTAEKYDGNSKTRLLLDKWPVTAVSALSVDGTAITARATVTDTGFVFDTTGITLVGYSFTKGVQNVSVTYTAGYATCPEDLAWAVKELVAFKYKRRDSLGKGSASSGGESVTYADAGVLAGIEDVLNRYRGPGVA